MRFLMLTILAPLTIWNLSAETVNKPQNEKSGIIAENAKPVLISDQFKFTEGPAVNKNGDIFFTDIVEGKIWKYSTEGELSLFMDKTGHSDGMYFDKKGNLKHIKSLKFWPIREVLAEKYHFSKEDAQAVEDFMKPLLDFDPKSRSTALDALRSKWLR